METVKRSAFQGLSNIVRFNWHFYMIAFLALTISGVIISYLDGPLKETGFVFIILVTVSIVVSLAVSYYIYDISDLYKFTWISKVSQATGQNILNIHAGFDESSALIQNRFKNSTLHVLDFYNPAKHTEISIKRARRAYGSYPGTISISAERIPFHDSSVHQVFLILAAHEIRHEDERTIFFKEVKRVLRAGGTAAVTEHQRDLPNFLAYNIGFLHFQTRASWLRVFKAAGLRVQEEIKNTPFISTFILKND